MVDVNTGLISFLRYCVENEQLDGLGCLSMEYIDMLSGLDFEIVCAYILMHTGFTDVCVTAGARDYGADILVRDRDFSYAVQCKRQTGSVGNKAVQEAFSGKAYYNCDKAIVMTNSYFTKPARIFAGETGVMLFDRGYIERVLCEF